MSEKMTEIYRVGKTENYSIIHNEVLRRDDLSWKAKGIMAYILTLPNDWKIYLEELQTHATDGERAFRSGWNELKEKGYVDRQPVKVKGKIVAWKTIVKENVDLETFPPDVQNAQVENVQVQNEDVQNVELLSTNNTNYLSKPSTKKPPVPSKQKYGEFQNVLLTDEEHKKLVDKYPEEYLNRIDRLSYYIESSGKKYKNHYATILTWAKKDEETKEKKVLKGASLADKLQELR